MSVPDTTPGAPSNPNNPFGDAAAATRSMIDAANTADVSPAPQAQPDPQIDTPTPGTTPDPTQDTGTPLSWDAIDLSVLPEDAQKLVRDGYLRHSDYTRKTQELAEQRKQIEQYGDPETVSEAMAFVQNLQDPEFLVQLQSDIAAHLATSGGGGTAPAVTAPSAEQASPGLDPAISRDLAELKQWKAEQMHQIEEAQLVDQMQQKLQTAEDSIRADYPSYTQMDIDAIYKLSPGTGYDLFQAQAQYEEFRNHFTKSLIGNKDQIPGVANNVRSDALYHAPTEMNDFKSAKEATAALFAAAE